MIKYLLFILLTPAFSSQENCSGCTVFLKPVIGVELELGEGFEKTAEKVNYLTPISGKYLKYIPPHINGYTAKKEITLPNGKETIVLFHLYFKNEKLDSYNLVFKIGKDRSLFLDLIRLIEQEDVNNINEFIYSQDDKNSFYDDLFSSENCKRILSVDRNLENDNIYEVRAKVF